MTLGPGCCSMQLYFSATAFRRRHFRPKQVGVDRETTLLQERSEHDAVRTVGEGPGEPGQGKEPGLGGVVPGPEHSSLDHPGKNQQDDRAVLPTTRERAEQPDRPDLEPGLLPGLAAGRAPRVLVELQVSRGKPPVADHGRVAALHQQDRAALDHGDRDGRGGPPGLDVAAARAEPPGLERTATLRAEAEVSGHVE